MFVIALGITTACASRFETLEGDATWADSSGTIYFASVKPEEDFLCSIAFDGSHRRRLSSAPAYQYVLSPDGGWIGAVLRNGRCEIVEVQSGTLTPLGADCESVDWSPSGVMLRIRKADGALGVYDRERGVYRDLVKTPLIRGEPRWSVDGEEIYYCSAIGGECSAVDVDRGKTRSLGRFENNRELWEGVIGLERVHLNQFGDSVSGFDRQVSPGRNRTALIWDGSLWIGDRKFRKERLLLEEGSCCRGDFGPFGFGNPYWSADERYVVGEVDKRIVIVETATGRAGVVTEGRHPVVWWPKYRPDLQSGTNIDYYTAIRLAGY